ncbi:hypothetical protein B0H10DRAFT_1953154 [Mycena sp. CBHHK59/15]|nr:hypothetical protein B0H10DRAFT_1953154 [Mycena sp. CBHHK59/15]
MSSSKRKREEWFVEVITKARRTDSPHLPDWEDPLDPGWEYFVKWAGWDDEDNSWEPVGNLQACVRLVKSFWEDIGVESFMTNQSGFIVEARSDWIMKEKLYFATTTSRSEVDEQNKNPKKSRKGSQSKSTASPSARPKGEHARKNTGQCAKAQQLDGTSDDDVPIAISANSSKTGFKIRIPPIPLSTPPKEVSPPPSPGHASPPGSPNSLFTESPPSPPPTPPRSRTAGISASRGIKIYDPASVSPGSKLATKSRLAKASVAPGIPRASPAPCSVQPATAEAPPGASSVANDPMQVNPGPTLVPDNSTSMNVDVDVTEEIGPMLSSMSPFAQVIGNEDIGDFDDQPGFSSGFYDPGDDPYSGLRPVVDSYVGQYDFEDDSASRAESLMDEVDQFLQTIPLEHPKMDLEWMCYDQSDKQRKPRIVCENAMLKDCTEPEGKTLRFGAFVLSREPLQFTKFYDVMDILLFLPGCKPAHQFGRLVPKDSDGAALTTVMEYMTKKKQVLLLPAMFDGEVVGYLLFFPHTMETLLRRMKVPVDLHTPGACSPPTEPRLHYRRHFNRFEEKMERVLLSPKSWSTSLRLERAYHIGLRLMKLPKDMHDLTFKHPSIVWYRGCEGDARVCDLDTKHLLQVLKKSEAGVVSAQEQAADIIFIHVGAIKNIHILPHLSQRRLRPHTRFCTYGTDEKVPETYAGGVVTFTPEALIIDPWGVLKAIRNIQAHPLWACYLLPQVLGMAVRVCKEVEYVDSYRGPFPLAFQRILQAAEDGMVAMLNAPPLTVKPRGTQQILEHCTALFDNLYPTSRRPEWATLVRNDILMDLRRIQIQPFQRQLPHGLTRDSRTDIQITLNNDGEFRTSAHNIVGSGGVGVDALGRQYKMTSCLLVGGSREEARWRILRNERSEAWHEDQVRV